MNHNFDTSILNIAEDFYHAYSRCLEEKNPTKDNQYYIYQHQELTSNPFNEASNQVINSDSSLYGYYQNLMN